VAKAVDPLSHTDRIAFLLKSYRGGVMRDYFSLLDVDFDGLLLGGNPFGVIDEDFSDGKGFHGVRVDIKYN
jgi:hypothetical protein